MNRLVRIEIIIIVVTLAIILPLTFLASGTSVTKCSQAVTGNSRALTFDLLSGQTVTGSLDFSGGSGGAWFQIYDSNGNIPTMYERKSEGTHMDFSLTANVDSKYYVYIVVGDSSTQYINYTYWISPPPILGLTPEVLIGIVITLGVVAALTVAVFRKQDKALTN